MGRTYFDTLRFPLLVKVPHLRDFLRRQVVHRDDGLTPMAFRKWKGEGLFAVEHRPRFCQFDPFVEENAGDHGVAAADTADSFVVLVHVHVVAYCFLHRCSGNDIPSPTVGKLDVKICWRSNVIGFLWVIFVEKGS